MVDCIYVTASTLDARLTRICVASVRYFYPDTPIRLLAGGRLQAGLASELRRHWNVHDAAVAAGDYGWGFVKLEPLFGPAGERFLMLDSDIVITGRVLDDQSDAPFVVAVEDFTEENIRSHFYDWRKVREIDADARAPEYVFNSGQWIGTSGVLTRADFAGLVRWSLPRTLRYPDHFYPGDQGILNYVLNQKAMSGAIRVVRGLKVRWPGFGLDGVGIDDVALRRARPEIIHWAGLKKRRLRQMVGWELLSFFEDEYYRRIPAARIRRTVAVGQDAATQWVHRGGKLVQRGARKYLTRS